MSKRKNRRSRVVKLSRHMDPDRVIRALKSKGYSAEYQNAIRTNAPDSQLRGYRANSSKTPTWLVPAIVVSGLVSLWLWKQANPGKSLNPTV